MIGNEAEAAGVMRFGTKRDCVLTPHALCAIRGARRSHVRRSPANGSQRSSYAGPSARWGATHRRGGTPPQRVLKRPPIRPGRSEIEAKLEPCSLRCDRRGRRRRIIVLVRLALPCSFANLAAPCEVAADSYYLTLDRELRACSPRTRRAPVRQVPRSQRADLGGVRAALSRSDAWLHAAVERLSPQTDLAAKIRRPGSPSKSAATTAESSGRAAASPHAYLARYRATLLSFGTAHKRATLALSPARNPLVPGSSEQTRQ